MSDLLHGTYGGRGKGWLRAAGRLSGGMGLLLALVVSDAPASAQQTATITGQVTDARSGAALSSVQVYLSGTGTGTLTNAAGRYLMLNVPPGSYTIRVERIGYSAVTQAVTVSAGQTVNQDFALSEEALGLDEIVVTGTAGAARRREVGNSIGELNTADLTESLSSTADLLQGRVSGTCPRP